MDIRDNLKAYICDNSLKQSAIAAKAGMTPSQLCAVMKKRRALGANEFFDICNALGTDADTLRKYTTKNTDIAS